MAMNREKLWMQVLRDYRFWMIAFSFTLGVLAGRLG